MRTEANDLRDQRIVELTRQGRSATDIAVMERVTPRSVYRIRQRCGISGPVTWLPMTDDEIATATALFNDGASRAEVARTLGRDQMTIERRFPGQCWTGRERAEYLALLRSMKGVL